MVNTQTNAFSPSYIHDLNTLTQSTLVLEGGTPEEAVSAAAYDRRGNFIILGSTKVKIFLLNIEIYLFFISSISIL